MKNCQKRGAKPGTHRYHGSGKSPSQGEGKQGEIHPADSKTNYQNPLRTGFGAAGLGCRGEKRMVQKPNPRKHSTTQGTRKRGSVHGPGVRKMEQPLGKSRKEKSSPGHWGGCKRLTQRRYKCQVLQHHIIVQASLSLIEETPFLPGEVHNHILQSHTVLS